MEPVYRVVNSAAVSLQTIFDVYTLRRFETTIAQIIDGDAKVVELDEHERTMAFAEVALGQIRSLRQTAVPRNYEIWYVYATGYNSSLNKIINETLARNGKLTEADLEQIYETYLSPDPDHRPHRQDRCARHQRDR